jgi:membrane protein
VSLGPSGDENDLPAVLPASDDIAETRVERLKRWSTSAMSWAVSASERHLSVALGFRAAERNRRVAAAVLAGGFAYRLFFWMLAVGLVAGGVFGLLGGSSTEQALEKAGIPGAVVSTVGQFASESGSARWWLLGLGLYLMLWSGYTGAKAASLVHALIWEEPPAKLTRPILSALWFSGVLLSIYLMVLGTWWLYDTDALAAVVAVIVLVAPLTALWVLVSLRLPHGDADWRALLPGAVLMAVGLQVLHAATLWFVVPKLDRSSSLYGPLGGVATLLFWMYMAGRLVVTAPILNAALHEERRRKSGGGQVPSAHNANDDTPAT